MGNLIRDAMCHVHSRAFDSTRWATYAPRADDIIIATYPKCGTTWTQRIVSMLVFQSADPLPIQQISPWPDMRMFGPIEEVMAQAEAQTHRRFLKSHLPYDALPVYEGVKFIHVARDGRDAAMSFHNHQSNYTPPMAEAFNAVSLSDPKFGTPFLPVPEDPARFFHEWVEGEQDSLGDPRASFFHVENSFWAARNEKNVLLVHYNDLKKDRGGEMRRIAAFLEIDIPESRWPDLIEAASFEAMKSLGSALLPGAENVWEGGADRFLHKGANGRWQDVVSAEDLARYDAKVKASFSPDLAQWIAHGRLGAAAETAV
jgi:aryl sulfotransferase